MIVACPLPWLFLGTAPRRVEVDVLTRIATARARSAAVHFAGFVVDVGTFAGFWRDIATVSKLAFTGVRCAVAVLQMALSGMIHAVVFIAGIAVAFTEAICARIGVAGFDADIIDRFGSICVCHGDFLRSKSVNARQVGLHQSSATVHHISKHKQG